ncbi:MAG: hypothetical protein V2B15_16730 [Bacteroidota bacterium]
MRLFHLPSADSYICEKSIPCRQWIQLIAEELMVEPGIQTIPAWMLRVLGLFIPMMREFPEMLYQYEQDYFFDSSKFEKRFGIVATSSKVGVRNLIDFLKNTKRQPLIHGLNSYFYYQNINCLFFTIFPFINGFIKNFILREHGFLANIFE